MLQLHSAIRREGRQRPGSVFERPVLPLLTNRYYECHSHQTKSNESGLMLESRIGWETGGDCGPALVAEKPDVSLRLKAVSYLDDDLWMPPAGRLSNDEIAVFRKWTEVVKGGRKVPRFNRIPSRQRLLSPVSETMGSLTM